MAHFLWFLAAESHIDNYIFPLNPIFLFFSVFTTCSERYRCLDFLQPYFYHKRPLTRLLRPLRKMSAHLTDSSTSPVLWQILLGNGARAWPGRGSPNPAFRCLKAPANRLIKQCLTTHQQNWIQQTLSTETVRIVIFVWKCFHAEVDVSPEDRNVWVQKGLPAGLRSCKSNSVGCTNVYLS